MRIFVGDIKGVLFKRLTALCSDVYMGFVIFFIHKAIDASVDVVFVFRAFKASLYCGSFVVGFISVVVKRMLF